MKRTMHKMYVISQLIRHLFIPEKCPQKSPHVLTPRLKMFNLQKYLLITRWEIQYFLLTHFHSFPVHMYNKTSYCLQHKMLQMVTLLLSFVPFWVIPRRLSSNCRRFGTHCRFHLHRQVNSPAYEDGTNIEFRNVGNYNSDAGELSKKEQITFRTRQKHKNKNCYCHFTIPNIFKVMGYKN